MTAVTFSGDVGTGVAPGENRHVVWNAGADWPNKKGDVKAIVRATKENENGKHGGVQLWKDGPYWADRNIGADEPWEYGLYFWWGDTVGHRPSEKMFDFSFTPSNTPTCDKSISALQSEGWIVEMGDGTYVLAPSHDAAQVQWGGGWRMPTYQELNDLCYYKCDWTWMTTNGVNGYVVRGRGDYSSNSIFLPAAGFGVETVLDNPSAAALFWSSVPRLDDNRAWYLAFQNAFPYMLDDRCRSDGQSIRPVQEFATSDVGFAAADVTTCSSEWFFVDTTYGYGYIVFPELGGGATAADVKSALSSGADVGLTNITDVAVYEAFRQWADFVKGADGVTAAGAQAVKDSTMAWLSFALGADMLIEKELTSDDVKIESFTPALTNGKFEFTVSVKDVNIGSGSVAVETLKDNLKKVLGVEGTARLDGSAFSSENIEIIFNAPVDGKARFTVTSPADVGNSFFMRVKVK